MSSPTQTACAYAVDFAVLPDQGALLAPLLGLLCDDAFKYAILDLGGYVTRETGTATPLI